MKNIFSPVVLPELQLDHLLQQVGLQLLEGLLGDALRPVLPEQIVQQT